MIKDIIKSSYSYGVSELNRFKRILESSHSYKYRKKQESIINKAIMDIEYNSNAQKYKQLGNQAYKSQDYNKAINYYTKAIEADHSDSSFFSNRSLCYFNLNRYEECIKDCERALLINPTFVKVLKKKAQACVNILRFTEAIEAAKQVVSIQRSTIANNQLQQIQSLKSNYDRYIQGQRASNYPQALSCIVHLVNKIPSNVTLKLNKVECLAKTGETKQAANLLNTIHKQNTPQFYYLKGIIELYSGDNAKAKKYFTEGMRLDPQNRKCQIALNKAKKCESYKQQGNQLIKQQKWKQAQMKYTQALNLDPFNKKLNSIIYSNRALTFMKRGLKINALEDLNKSLELNPNYMKSLVRRAELNMERQDYTVALNDYSKIQELDPSVNLKAKIEQAKKKEKQAKKKDYYAILGVPRTATQAEIKKAYKSLALKFHPDRNRGKSEVEQEESSKKFKDIAQAHGVLTDAEKKKKYDSGQMEYDGDQGAGGFENMNFNSGNMGGMGSNVKFSFNGADMGGMGGIDPSQIFQMFFNNKGSSFGGFPGMNGMSQERSNNKRSSSNAKGCFNKNQFNFA